MSRISKTNKDINNYGYKFLSSLAYLLSFVLCDALLFFYLDLNLDVMIIYIKKCEFSIL
jgi:hypothetical protein